MIPLTNPNKKSIESIVNKTFDPISQKIDNIGYIIETKSGHEGVPYAIREDFAIDRDERIIEYDKWLLSNGFKYIHTLMGRYGGKRIYTHPSGIDVGVSRWENNILWYIDRSSDAKPIADGSGLHSLISKLRKLTKE